jgi:Dyp-type peroxidase family
MASIDLTTRGISIDGSEFAAIADEIQGNILKSHGRGHTSQIFFKFNPNKVDEAKIFISEFANKKITTAAKQKEYTQLYKDKNIEKTFYAFYLSSWGYDYLGFNKKTQQPNDISFLNGMKGAQGKLNDPASNTWDNGYKGDIHGMILIARGGSTRSVLDSVTTAIKNSLTTNDLATVLCDEKGDGIKNANNDDIEHFGYVDGISQPRFFNEEIPTPPPTYWNSLMPLNLVLVSDPNSTKDNAFGSYFVYRKLEQNVKAFKEKEEKLSIELFGSPQTGQKPNELAGAMVVGRFENGMPATLSATDKNTYLTANPGKFNDFNYANDQDGAKCPYHAHIRKTNPRGDSSRLGANLEQEKFHMMARRGIIYGKRDIHPNDGEIKDMPTGGVGLLFMSFQADIVNQFEFMQINWANNEGFVNPITGLDPVIGQGTFPDGVHKYARTYDYASTIEPASGFGGFVTLKGGEYFFAPSMAFLRNLGKPIV